MSVADKVVLITGAARGLGFEYARFLGEAGARIVAGDIADCTAAAGAAGNGAIGVTLDVTDIASADSMVELAMERFGRVDALINNAALYGSLRGGRFNQIAEADWDATMAVNVKGIWNCCKAVVPAMRQSGGGSIINIASLAATYGMPFALHYTTSKAAVIGLTRGLARELGRDNIRVNALAPSRGDDRGHRRILRRTAGPRAGGDPRRPVDPAHAGAGGPDRHGGVADLRRELFRHRADDRGRRRDSHALTALASHGPPVDCPATFRCGETPMSKVQIVAPCRAGRPRRQPGRHGVPAQRDRRGAQTSLSQSGLVGEIQGPTMITDPAKWPKKFAEAPMLAELVKAGKLPPVEQRIPAEPMVWQPLNEIGKYGGTWRRAFTGPARRRERQPHPVVRQAAELERGRQQDRALHRQGLRTQRRRQDLHAASCARA